jgi:NADPH:quinone reductase-like Zn-dependent oxidoreductase
MTLQVYIEMKLAPVTPADLYTMRLGGLYDDQGRDPPFVAGHEGVAVVVKVRAPDSYGSRCAV